MKKKLVLINPVDHSFKNLASSADRRSAPLGLGIIAALTPHDWDIELIDENFNDFSYVTADLVGITAYTCNVAKAYKIAEIYRQNNVHTVLGGIHATVLPEEAGKYVDTVVVGEGENTWPELLSDFDKGCIKKQYKGTYHSLINLPKPRRDLFDARYTHSVVQTSRGCALHCDFCSIPAISGKKPRFRPVDEVLDELETIKYDSVFFTDDNLFGIGKENVARNTELFEGMIKRKINKTWITFAGVNCTDNEELIELAARSGCDSLYLGIETEDLNALECSGKKINLKYAKDNYGYMINILHKHGIRVFAGIVYGFDTDNKQNITKRTNFALKSLIDSFHVTVLTPFPGTPLYNRLRNEGRILYDASPEYWCKYNFTEMVFSPKQINKNDFDLLMNKTYKKLYNKWLLKLRFLKILFKTRNMTMAKRGYKVNIGVGRSYNN